jgi:hypothetical protein
MKIDEIVGAAPKSPEQAKIQALKSVADRARAAVKAERQRQRIRKAQRHMARLLHSPATEPTKPVGTTGAKP